MESWARHRNEGGTVGGREGGREGGMQSLTLFISNVVDDVVSLHHCLLGVAAARAGLPLLDKTIH